VVDNLSNDSDFTSVGAFIDQYDYHPNPISSLKSIIGGKMRDLLLPTSTKRLNVESAYKSQRTNEVRIAIKPNSYQSVSFCTRYSRRYEIEW